VGSLWKNWKRGLQVVVGLHTRSETGVGASLSYVNGTEQFKTAVQAVCPYAGWNVRLGHAVHGVAGLLSASMKPGRHAVHTVVFPGE
jgi:hypothetical protein